MERALHRRTWLLGNSSLYTPDLPQGGSHDSDVYYVGLDGFGVGRVVPRPERLVYAPRLVDGGGAGLRRHLWGARTTNVGRHSGGAADFLSNHPRYTLGNHRFHAAVLISLPGAGIGGCGLCQPHGAYLDAVLVARNLGRTLFSRRDRHSSLGRLVRVMAEP